MKYKLKLDGVPLQNKLRLIETAMLSLQSDINDTDALKTIGKAITSITGVEVEDITINDNSKQLFGMAVFRSSVASMVKKIMLSDRPIKQETLDLLGSMDIEIDRKIFDKAYKFTNRELVAILLHEVGHVACDLNFYNEMKMALIKVSNEKGNPVDVENLTYLLYVLTAIEDTHVTKISTLKNEQMADLLPIELGYGEDLVSALNRFTLTYGHSTDLYATREKIAEGSARKALQLDSALKMRTDAAIQILKTESKMTPYKWIKKSFKDFIFNAKHILKRNDKKPQYGMLSESFLDSFKLRPSKITQLDIDNLKVEKEMLETYDDKLILVSRIHHKMGSVQESIDANIEDGHINKALESYKKQLSELLKQVMLFKPVDKTYGVFIKYPKGYEG